MARDLISVKLWISTSKYTMFSAILHQCRLAGLATTDDDYRLYDLEACHLISDPGIRLSSALQF
jgi:hypothetical protein